jgi:2-polyprenyl-6-methoxyphenol hydroxylase-like FAD-dependent oxidoreductase
MQHYEVIIAGAGPTGLMMACQLSRAGVDCLVLDKKQGPTTESRALVVQARSMEIYEQMGLSDEVERTGQPSDGVSLYKKGRKAAAVYLRTMGVDISPFPYVMIYEQSKNETLLCQKLQASGKAVQWNTEIGRIEEKEGLYQVWTGTSGVPTAAPGADAAYSCRYLIACDGSRSAVREFSGMDFTGGTYENVFYVADIHGRLPKVSSTTLSMFLTRRAITMLFPMPGKENFRLLGILPPEYYHRDNITFEELIDHAKANMQVPVEFYALNWYSTYKLHYKKVGHFNKGNIFFAGDAAHVHSPAGGQGMNTGLQDAYNLAWKLALVVRGKASAALLDSYHEERNPVAEQLLKTTDRGFSVMIKSNAFFGFLKLFVIPTILPFFNRFARMRRVWFEAVSQTRIHYRQSSLSKGTAGTIKAGSRFPWFQLSSQGRTLSVYHLIREHQRTPFLILLYRFPAEELNAMDANLLTLLSLDDNAANATVLNAQGFPESFVVILRPDNYIAYISATLAIGEMTAFLREAYHLFEF